MKGRKGESFQPMRESGSAKADKSMKLLDI
jgi:hypothetical protein